MTARMMTLRMSRQRANAGHVPATAIAVMTAVLTTHQCGAKYRTQPSEYHQLLNRNAMNRPV